MIFLNQYHFFSLVEFFLLNHFFYLLFDALFYSNSVFRRPAVSIPGVSSSYSTFCIFSSLISFIFSLYFSFLSRILLEPTHFFITQIKRVAPEKIAKYFNQQGTVQIPFPQHTPVRRMIKIGRQKRTTKFLICMLQEKSKKQGTLKKLWHL